MSQRSNAGARGIGAGQAHTASAVAPPAAGQREGLPRPASHFAIPPHRETPQQQQQQLLLQGPHEGARVQGPVHRQHSAGFAPVAQDLKQRLADSEFARRAAPPMQPSRGPAPQVPLLPQEQQLLVQQTRSGASPALRSLGQGRQFAPLGYHGSRDEDEALDLTLDDEEEQRSAQNSYYDQSRRPGGRGGPFGGQMDKQQWGTLAGCARVTCNTVVGFAVMCLLLSVVNLVLTGSSPSLLLGMAIPDAGRQPAGQDGPSGATPVSVLKEMLGSGRGAGGGGGGLELREPTVEQIAKGLGVSGAEEGGARAGTGDALKGAAEGNAEAAQGAKEKGPDAGLGPGVVQGVAGSALDVGVHVALDVSKEQQAAIRSSNERKREAAKDEGRRHRAEKAPRPAGTPGARRRNDEENRGTSPGQQEERVEGAAASQKAAESANKAESKQEDQAGARQGQGAGREASGARIEGEQAQPSGAGTSEPSGSNAQDGQADKARQADGGSGSSKLQAKRGRKEEEESVPPEIRWAAFRDDPEEAMRRKPFSSSCNVTDGRWIRDETYPLWRAGTCMLDQAGFACARNGSWPFFRWQPRGCNLTRFGVEEMRQRMRGKRLAFIGDSLARNQFQSALCMLAAGLPNGTVTNIAGSEWGKRAEWVIFAFHDYNFTVEYILSHYQVPVRHRNDTYLPEIQLVLDTDSVDYAVPGKLLDRGNLENLIAVFNAGHWYTDGKLMKRGIFFQVKKKAYSDMSILDGYRAAMRTLGTWMEELHALKVTTVWRTYVPTHFLGGTWDKGGSCRDGDPMPGLDGWKPDQIAWMTSSSDYLNIMREVAQSLEHPPFVLDVTYMSLLRPDAHIGEFARNRFDCSHWCMPGVPDIWNEIMFAQLRDQGKL